MHQREALGVEKSSTVGGGRLVGIKAVGDRLRSEAETVAQIASNRLGDGDHSVRGRQHAALEPGIQAGERRTRPGRMWRVECPAVAQVGDPGHPAAAQDEAHEVRRLRRSGGDHAVGPQRPGGLKGARKQEGQPGDQREVRHHQRLQRARLPVAAGASALHGLEALAPPVQPRGEQVSGTDRGRTFDRSRAGGQRGQDRHAVTAAA